MTDAEGPRPPDPPRVLLDAREAAAYLAARGGRWSARGVRRAWAAGRLPGLKRGHVLVFRVSDLEVLATSVRPPRGGRPAPC